MEYNTTGDGNTALGLYSLVGCTTGNDNCCVGSQCGTAITTESFNTCIGAGADILGGVSNATAIGYAAVASESNQIAIGISSNNTVIPGTFNALGISTFTAGMMMGTASTAYIVYYGTASVSSSGSSIPSYASSQDADSQLTTICTLDNTFPTQIIGCIVNSGNSYVWANYVSAISNNSIYASFINLGVNGDYIPSTIFYMAFGN
jgi:hypothetical protein